MRLAGQPVYEALLETAGASGLSPADWIARHLPRNKRDKLSKEGLADSLECLLRHAGSIDLGRPTGIENEQIDADLAREYETTHEDES